MTKEHMKKTDLMDERIKILEAQMKHLLESYGNLLEWAELVNKKEESK